LAPCDLAAPTDGKRRGTPRRKWPTTSSAYLRHLNRGARIRTGDPLLPKHILKDPNHGKK